MRPGLRARVLALALAPALTIALLLGVYFVTEQLRQLHQALVTRGEDAARQLAALGLPAAAAGDRVRLAAAVDAARGRTDVVYAAVFDGRGRPAAMSRAPGIEWPAPGRAEPPGDTLFFASGVPGVGGQAVVGIRTAEERAAHRAALARAAAILSVGLLFAALLAAYVNRTVVRPIRRLSAGVERLALGKLDTRLALDAEGEIRTLQQGVNLMAASLEAAQQDLQAQVERATAELVRQKEAAERANAAKSRFLAAASHDLRQPMHVLSLFVAALKDQQLSGEARTLADKIEASSAAMEGMFNALLDISRLEAGVMTPKTEHFPVQLLLNRLSNAIAPLAQQKRLSFRVRPSLLTVHSDPILLERVLMNLGTNAVRYTDHGGVLIGCRRRAGRVLVQVWDTGCGIAEHAQEEIFIEFHQLSGGPRDRGEGMGLGLAIVDRVAQLLGHPVRLRSRVGRGSVFEVEVPLAASALTLTDPRTSLRYDGLPGSVRVLVLDDAPPILDAMRQLLGGWGCEVTTAQDPAEAIQKLDGEPQLILSDYRLAGVNGVDAMRAVSGHFGRAIPGIVITGDTSPAGVRELQASGHPHIFKPVRPAKLRALMVSLLRAQPG